MMFKRLLGPAMAMVAAAVLVGSVGAGAARTPGDAPFEFFVDVPADEVFRTQRTAVAVATGGGALLLAAAFAFYGWLVVRVTRPIRDLTSAVRRVGAGEPAARLPAELLALQATVFRYSQAVEVVSRATDKLIGAVKQTLGTQV